MTNFTVVISDGTDNINIKTLPDIVDSALDRSLFVSAMDLSEQYKLPPSEVFKHLHGAGVGPAAKHSARRSDGKKRPGKPTLLFDKSVAENALLRSLKLKFGECPDA